MCHMVPVVNCGKVSCWYTHSCFVSSFLFILTVLTVFVFGILCSYDHGLMTYSFNCNIWKVLSHSLFLYSFSNSLHLSHLELSKHIELLLPCMLLTFFVIVFYCFDILGISKIFISLFEFSLCSCVRFIMNPCIHLFKFQLKLNLLLEKYSFILLHCMQSIFLFLINIFF